MTAIDWFLQLWEADMGYLAFACIAESWNDI
jgi:hypothetical protein